MTSLIFAALLPLLRPDVRTLHYPHSATWFVAHKVAAAQSIAQTGGTRA